jgi:AcrR family transcriptional regulator
MADRTAALPAPEMPLRSGADSPAAWETRKQIIETAERLYRQYGYRKTTVADMAAELEMSPANVYRFFASKDAISAEVAATIANRLHEAAQKAANGPGSAVARIARLIREIHHHNRTQLLDDRKMHEMVHVAVEENWPVCDRYIEAIQGAFAVVIADGVQRGEFKVEDVKVAAACTGAASATLFHPLLIEQCLFRDLAPEMEAMIRFIVGALGGDPKKVPAPGR